MDRAESLVPPRPRDASRTRSGILHAAITLFANRGYAATGVREVAALAGVNSALVGRYFGSKEQLYYAALDTALDLSPLFDADRAGFGENTIRVFFDTKGLPSPLAMMILSAADPEARAASAALLHTRVIKPLADWLGPPDGEVKATQLNILWNGFFTSWLVLPLETLSDKRVAPVRRWLETTTQAIVDAPPPTG